MENNITFKVVSYYDPYGDKKSNRKVFSRRYYQTKKTKKEIMDIFNKRNEVLTYYSQEIVIFPLKPYITKKMKYYE